MGKQYSIKLWVKALSVDSNLRSAKEGLCVTEDAQLAAGFGGQL